MRGSVAIRDLLLPHKIPVEEKKINDLDFERKTNNILMVKWLRFFVFLFVSYQQSVIQLDDCEYLK